MRDKPITCGVVEKVVSDAEGPAPSQASSKLESDDGVLLF
jgi:hypothetical protein